MNYRELQDSLIKKYRMTINTKSTCRSRMHVHVKKRVICKWEYKNSALATFELLHEIGHCENNDSSMRRCEQEFYATQWAIDRCKELGIKIDDKTKTKYQNYVWRERQRGINRHCDTLPSKEELTLQWYEVRRVQL